MTRQAAFPLARVRDDADERRQANRAVVVSVVGLGVTGLVELLLAVLTGSVGLLDDAIHNLSDVSTSAVVFLGCRKLVEHGHTAHVGAGILGALLGIAGNQVVARYKLRVGKWINSATLIADARHFWLDALLSAGALAGLIAVAPGSRGAPRWPGWSSRPSSVTSATR